MEVMIPVPYIDVARASSGLDGCIRYVCPVLPDASDLGDALPSTSCIRLWSRSEGLMHAHLFQRNCIPARTTHVIDRSKGYHDNSPLPPSSGHIRISSRQHMRFQSLRLGGFRKRSKTRRISL